MVTNKLPAPVSAHVACPDCGGTGIVEESIAVGPRYAPTPNDWDVIEFPCERCNGTKVLPAAVCEECNAVVPVDSLEYGACPSCLVVRCFS